MSWSQKNFWLWITFIVALILAFIANIVLSGTFPLVAFVETLGAGMLFLAVYHALTKRSKRKAEEQYKHLGDPRLRTQAWTKKRERDNILGHFLFFWTVVPFLALFAFLVIFALKLVALTSMFQSPIFYSFMQMLPQLAMAPLFMFAWMFIWYGSLTIPGYLQARLIKPGDAEYGVYFEDVRAQEHAVTEAKKQLKLLQAWSQRRKKSSKTGIMHIIASFLFWWIAIPYLLIRSLWLKHGARKEQKSAQIHEILMKSQHLLFFGPPGTGKTYLGVAIATESNLPVLLIPATVMHQPFLGVGVILWQIITMFKIYGTARKWGGVIVIIDEIDSFARARSGMVSESALTEAHSSYTPKTLTPCGLAVNDAPLYKALESVNPSGIGIFVKAIRDFFRAAMPGGMWGSGGVEAVLTQVMMMLDGHKSPPLFYQIKREIVNLTVDGLFGWLFLIGMPEKITIGGKTLYFRLPPGKPEDLNFLMIGLTNLIQVLDPAILRPGRLGRHIQFRNPNHEGIKSVAGLYFFRYPHDSVLDQEEWRDKFAKLMRGSSPVQVKEVIEEAAHLAIERVESYEQGQPPFNWQDIVEARRNLRYGHKVHGEHSEESEHDTAVHEWAHLLTGLEFLKDRESIIEFSAMARGESRGRVDTVPVDDRSSKTNDRTAYEARLRVFLAGRIIEEIVFGEERSGGRHDLAAATAIVSYMVGELMYHPRECSEADYKEYKEKGLGLLSLTITTPFGRPTVVEDVLNKEHFRERAAVILGQAWVDAHQFLILNKEVLLSSVRDFFTRGEMREYSGADLEDLMKEIKLAPLGIEVKFPERSYSLPFRHPSVTEGVIEL